MKLSWTKSAFWDVNNKKLRKWSKCVYLSYLITHDLRVLTMGTKCPNEVLYVWLVDLQAICDKQRLEKYSHQIIIFVYICSTWGTVELKTRFETWIKRSNVIGVSLYHLSYLITLMCYLCSQSTPN
jgi:hypothetical protein